jgi:hypothetical protein
LKTRSLETTDIFRGAFLLCRGGELCGIRFRSNGKRIASFLFTGKGLNKLDKQYRDGQALVNPLQFRESLNHLRDILFEKLREEDPSSHKCYDATSPASSRLGRDDNTTKGRMRNDDRKRNHRGDQTRR